MQSRKRLFSRGSKAREINNQKAELAAQESSDKKGSLTADQFYTKGTANSKYFQTVLHLFSQLIWLTYHQQQNKGIKRSDGKQEGMNNPKYYFP